jgi:uncharacterized protein YbjT (DUF2867 family)
MKIKAILFGATGMVGAGVLHVILDHPDVESVLVIGRRSCGVKHQKMVEQLHSDFFNYAAIEEQLKGFNACFFCLGVSSVGMSEKDYTRISYDLTMSAATVMSRLNPGMTFCYVSGTGTDGTENGRVMWARVKGRTENALMKLPFKAVYLFRPGFIKPIKGVDHAHAISAAVGLLYPVWKFFFPQYICTLEEMGLAMVHAAGQGYPHTVLENEDIVRLAKGISQ